MSGGIIAQVRAAAKREVAEVYCCGRSLTVPHSRARFETGPSRRSAWSAGGLDRWQTAVGHWQFGQPGLYYGGFETVQKWISCDSKH